MAKTTTVTCDGCGSDITHGSQPDKYNLFLGNEARYFAGGFATAMALQPPIERTHHFCGLNCMDLWSDKRRFKDSLWKEWWEKWAKENGRVETNFKSYPLPPNAVSYSARSEIEAKVIDKFSPNAPSPKASDDTPQ